MRSYSLIISILVAAVVAATTGYFVSKHTAGISGHLSESKPTDRWQEILDRGTIRAGYFVAAPYFSKDANSGAVSGIFADAMSRAASNLGLKIEWVEEVGFGEMIEGLRNKRFDIVGSGVWINAARAKGADFTEPLFYDAVGIYVRSDDTRFDKQSDAINSSSVTIATMDGEMAATIASQDFPNAKTLAIPQSSDFTQMMLNVVARKADIAIIGLGPATRFQQANPGVLRLLNPNHPIRVFPAAVMLPQGEYRLKRAIDLALGELSNDGITSRLIEKYEGATGSIYKPRTPFEIGTGQ